MAMAMRAWRRSAATSLLLVALAGCAEAKRGDKNRRMNVSPTISKVADVYANWLRGPELVDGVFAARPPECDELAAADAAPGGTNATGGLKRGCSALTRVVFMTAVGYWCVVVLFHGISHRLLKQYRKDWDAPRKLAWCAGLCTAAASLYLCFHAALAFWKDPRYALDAPGKRVLAVRSHSMDVLLAYAVGFRIFELSLAGVSLVVGALVDTSDAYNKAVLTAMAAASLVYGKWGALAGALLVFDAVTPVLKVRWLLDVGGARSASIAAELWGIVVTVSVVARAAGAVLLAAYAADHVEAEVRMSPRHLRGPVLFALVQVAALVALWIMQAKRRLRELGGAAVLPDPAGKKRPAPAGDGKEKKE